MKTISVLCSDRNGCLTEVENQPPSPEFYASSPVADIDNAEELHTIHGFGISFTDASCYLLAKLSPEARKLLLQDLFSPDKLNLSMARLNIGASDYAAEIYSYNDTPGDVDMKNFSIAHDLEYIIPAALEAMQYRPDIFWFASPWSPPAWMKAPVSFCGGYMREKYLPALANYLIEYLKAYRQQGINIQAISMQNEADTTQSATMPQSLLHPDFEMELVGRLMPPRLQQAGLDTRMWLYDHNYSGWNRVLYMLSDPDVAKNTGAVAWHPYEGSAEMTGIVRKAFPQIEFQLTEKGPNLRQDAPESDVFWWGRTISDALNNYCRSFFGWNLALDECGKPNLGNYDCAGLVTIHSQTREISYSAQYYAFRHFAPYLKKGAVILRSPLNYPANENISILTGRNPDGTVAAILTNSSPVKDIIQLKYQGKYIRLALPPESLTTVLL